MTTRVEGKINVLHDVGHVERYSELRAVGIREYINLSPCALVRRELAEKLSYAIGKTLGLIPGNP